ncbi:hypothetical protein OAG71_03055 [bacterium]|nr:hypothetical protein [bacterium]
MKQMKQKLARRLLAVICLPLLCVAVSAENANAQLFGFGRRNTDTAKTVMPKARTAMSEKLKIETKEGLLVFEFPKQEDAEGIAQSIIENSYSNSHSSNDDSYFCQTESDSAKFLINSGTNQWGQQTKDVKMIRLTDLNDETNRVEIKVDDSSKDLSLFSLDLAKRKIHIIRQTKQGVTLVAIDGDTFDYMSEKSVNDLVGQPEFVSKLDGFREAGLGLPKVASQSKIETLIESVLDFSEKDREAFESAFPDLTSKKFKLRKQAAKELSKKLKDFVVPVSAMLLSDSLPLEMRARFLEAITASDDEETVLVIRTIVGGKLTTSPTVLLRLLEHQTAAKASESTQSTIDQLEKVTGQQLGDDIEAWSRWISENVDAADAVDGKKTAPAANATKSKSTKKTTSKRRRLRKTGREQVEEPLKDLLKLKLSDSGAIELNRAHWVELFNGKSPSESMKEAKKSFEESGLPKSWLKMGGEHNVAGLGYEQILFERIADSVKIRSQNHQMHMHMNGQKTRSLNRTMYKSDMRLTMMVHEEGKRWEDKRHKRAFFKFLFEDEAEDLFYLLSEHPEQGFTIFVFWKDGETVLNLRCDREGKVQINHVSEKTVTSLSAESVGQLLKDDGEFVSDQILPLLTKIGISADQAFGDNEMSK